MLTETEAMIVALRRLEAAMVGFDRPPVERRAHEQLGV
jgi:hypothetical protein